uniref:Uncharacterized protein n=1 Tax=Picea sitchensis TaxID=3332 RepID=A9NP71_PICSI|nr:unknown [Picea sitchensis]ABK22954.1 unknown [Picea sitchensis]ABK23482.1 unknown [Picea sitchensis]
MSKVGFVCLLLCILLSLLLHGGSAARVFAENHGNKAGFPVPDNKAATMIKPEKVEGNKNVKAEEENITYGRELIFNVDYHGATTHPPAPPGTGHRN